MRCVFPIDLYEWIALIIKETIIYVCTVLIQRGPRAIAQLVVMQ